MPQWRVQATRDLLAASLDAILVKIERKDIKEGAQMTPLVLASSTPLAIAGNLQKAHVISLVVASPHLLAVDDKLQPARALPLAGASSLPLAVDGNLRTVRPCARPCHCTG